MAGQGGTRPTGKRIFLARGANSPQISPLRSERSSAWDPDSSPAPGEFHTATARTSKVTSTRPIGTQTRARRSANQSRRIAGLRSLSGTVHWKGGDFSKALAKTLVAASMSSAVALRMEIERAVIVELCDDRGRDFPIVTCALNSPDDTSTNLPALG